MAEERNGGERRRLARDPERRVLVGVCTGLGRYTGIDPVVFRVGFGLLVLAHGQGVFLYIVAVLLMPASPGESSAAERAFRRWFDAPAVLSALGALLCLGVAFSLFGGVSTDSIALLVVFALVMLVAHARGADLVGAARSLPERFAGHPPGPSAEWTTGASVSLEKRTPARTGGGLPDGMIDLADYGRARACAPPAEPWDDALPPERRRGRPRSPAATITLLAAMATGAALVPVARGYPGPESALIVMAPALAVVGLGLIVGGWFRTRGLAAVGTLLALALLAASVAAHLPGNLKYGDMEWRPMNATSTHQEYRIGVGQGTLDLTALPLATGQHVSVDARVGLGGMEVKVPQGARVRLDARIALGDLRIEHRTTSGPNAKVIRVLEPEGTAVKNPPEIDLRIRGKVGDVDVHRV
ncbi:PspC domain-containing protein [Actinomadura sp. LD22]|uniref:PspC domain-containing protein n=1 Tax=Actinomadura physcomitrii TaxID=2650748 RepID=A0A6I4MKC0_9ACTN|nr:PspC domain-containing protein [Actinomadura physcomitrii]MWA06302.1 PspC domain-containing protein [Actinomadura physcomitrii]